MADPRFFRAAGPFRLGDLARAGGARLSDAEADRLVSDVASLADAGPDQVTFYDERKAPTGPEATAAAACLIRAAMAPRLPAATAALIVDDPYRGFAMIAQKFYPSLPPVEAQIDATAVIDPTARLGEGCRIEPHVVIGAGAAIGDAVAIGAGTVVGTGVVVGDGGMIGSQVTLSHCLIGARVIVHPGVRIGQDGFGFAPEPTGLVKLPQLGRVVIGDEVEIGANTTIDRGTLGDTVIGSGTKIDNLVQIGHNVQIGKACVIVAQVGLSGSTIVGNGVMIGGQVGAAGHLRIGDGARVAGQSGLMRDVAAGETVFGTPAVPSRQAMRQVAMLARLANKKRDQ